MWALCAHMYMDAFGPMRQVGLHERRECPHPDVEQFSLSYDLTRRAGRKDGGGVGAGLSWSPALLRLPLLSQLTLCRPTQASFWRSWRCWCPQRPPRPAVPSGRAVS